MTVEQEILRAYERNLKDVLSINQISKRTKKAYPYVNKKVKLLIEQGILKRKDVGRSCLCTVNLSNKQTVMFLSLNEIAKHAQLPPDIINAIETIEKKRMIHNIYCITYDPAAEKLLITTESDELRTILGDGPWEFLNLSELKSKLLNDKEFFSNKIVIEGYEQFFNLLASSEIERRYHPLL